MSADRVEQLIAHGREHYNAGEYEQAEPFLAEARDQPFEPQQPGFGPHQGGEALGVGPDLVGAVELVPGERGRRATHPAAPASRSATIAAGSSSSSG